MNNPILLVKNAGYGATPECPQVKFKRGDIVKIRRLKHLISVPETGAVCVVVPPGFPAEYALADARKQPRPLMITRPSSAIKYIVAFEGDQAPYLLSEKSLIATGEKADVKIQGELDG